MDEPRAGTLRGKRLLVVEDEFLIATDLARSLEDDGVDVIGPVGSIDDALKLISTEHALGGAVLDIKVDGQLAYPIADALRDRGVPFVFATGYDAWVIPDSYKDVPRCEKPVDTRLLARLLSAPVL
jgi:ActR/RegA family two-component response regulator